MGPERTPVNVKIAGVIAGLTILGIGGNEFISQNEMLWYDNDEPNLQMNPDFAPATESAPVFTPQTISDKIEFNQSFIGVPPYFLYGTFNQETYRNEGLRFRNTIVVLDEIGDLRAQEMRDLYDKLRKAEGGRQYTEMWKEVEKNRFELIKIPFEPKAGDNFRISDLSFKKPGIYLRENPEKIDPETDRTFLYDFMGVKLIESKVVKTEEGEKVFWKVKVVDNDSFEDSGLEAEIGEEGYISEEFLGTKTEYLQR